jgi:hypothetical protein
MTLRSHFFFLSNEKLKLPAIEMEYTEGLGADRAGFKFGVFIRHPRGDMQ